MLTHNYTGYPMVRHARELVESGVLGDIRLVQMEYPQDWLAEPIEQTGAKQAVWRTDPAQSGAGGSTGDIGTHAYNLGCFISGLELDELAADVHTFVERRRLDDTPTSCCASRRRKESRRPRVFCGAARSPWAMRTA